MTIAIPTHDPDLHRAWWRALQRIDPGRAFRVFDSATALRILARDDVRADDVFAYVLLTRNQALLSARANREAWGHPTLGVACVESVGWMVVLDLRPALAKRLQPPPRVIT